jgi:phosphatidylserine decarboxylase
MNNYYLRVKFYNIKHSKQIDIKYYYHNISYSYTIKSYSDKSSVDYLICSDNFVDNNIDSIYIEINKYPHSVKLPNISDIKTFSDQITLSDQNTLPDQLTFSHKKYDVDFMFFKINKYIRPYKQIKYNEIKHNLNLLLNNNKKFLYFPKYQTLLPEWQSQTDIFYMISNYLNFKLFRIWITHFGLLKHIFNSKTIGKKMLTSYQINSDNYIIKKPITFRNVFLRRLSNPLVPINNTSIIYAPATSRVHYYNHKIDTLSNILIKNSLFRLNAIIKDQSFNPIHMIVFRLAPQDYHHFHMPIDGLLIDYYYLGDDYQSVNLNFIYSNKFNPLNDNYRLVLKYKYLNSDEHFYLVIIGATIVGSICVDNLVINRIYRTYEHLGYFDLGGSCIVFLTDKNKLNIRPDLKYYSKYNIETYLQVYEQLTYVEPSYKPTHKPTHKPTSKPIHNSNKFFYPKLNKEMDHMALISLNNRLSKQFDPTIIFILVFVIIIYKTITKST